MEWDDGARPSLPLVRRFLLYQLLAIQYLPTTELIAYVGNARVHSPGQVQQIANSLRAFGFMNPVLIDAKNQLIAGHGRLLAAKQLGLLRIPAIRVDHLSEAQRRAYALADNKIAENADWDRSPFTVSRPEIITIAASAGCSA